MRRERDTVLGAFEHQGVPFDVAVKALRLPRTDRPPLFQVAFAYLNLPVDYLDLSQGTGRSKHMQRGHRTRSRWSTASYARRTELDRRANQLAQELRAGHGVGPEVLVGICMERSLSPTSPRYQTRVIALARSVADANLTRSLLTSLGLPAEPATFAPARAPPQAELAWYDPA